MSDAVTDGSHLTFGILEATHDPGLETFVSLRARHGQDLVGLEVVFDKTWQHGNLRLDGGSPQPVYQGLVRFERQPPESDRLVAVLDELLGAGTGAARMAESVAFSAISVTGEPHLPENGAFSVLLEFEADSRGFGSDDDAQFFLDLDVAAGAGRIREKHPRFRRATVAALAR